MDASALAMDSKEQLSSSPPGEYSQEIPSKHTFDLGVPNAPPSLPPQLLQVKTLLSVANTYD